MTDTQDHDIIPLSFEDFLKRYNFRNLGENDKNMLKAAYLAGKKTAEIKNAKR